MNGLKEKYKNPDWDRIAHLFKIGIFASLLALIGGDIVSSVYIGSLHQNQRAMPMPIGRGL